MKKCNTAGYLFRNNDSLVMRGGEEADRLISAVVNLSAQRIGFAGSVLHKYNLMAFVSRFWDVKIRKIK